MNQRNIPPRWRKSSYSNSGSGGCVEVAPLEGEVRVRDSKFPTQPAITFSRFSWATFLAELSG
ncbi:hypothetical protein BLA24_19445 [Streptomyces cinnamoneus]|uniref:DUF397 domain-containing protein n=1 Tax=Streptomyces cinnamoneus TaxID=53446 RepID=A0A2G1XF18_STRCJ|nr:DUF397 domain-containing protein [Streptomyces cinnamoneus]PHQ49822.1 hypothetical protein BLA24_19445 [Streptomyces cinnamoneus]PPT13403.1 DUF397 domain-containing protein [Streptomyces cinnamoneus]